MIKLLLALITIIAFSGYSQTPLKINSLDSQRNCWYHFFEETKTLQLADFAGMKPIAIRTSMLDLEPSIRDGMHEAVNKLVTKIELGGEFETFLFCNSGGHTLVVNSYESIPPVIYMTRIDAPDNGELLLGSSQKGYTMGYSPHTLVVKHKNTIVSEHYKTLIKSFLSEQIAAIRIIPNSNSGRITTTPSYHYRMHEVKKMIEEHPVVGFYTEYVELSPNHTFAGEYALLFRGIFE